jgi:hypothetical protein
MYSLVSLDPQCFKLLMNSQTKYIKNERTKLVQDEATRKDASKLVNRQFQKRDKLMKILAKNMMLMI